MRRKLVNNSIIVHMCGSLYGKERISFPEKFERRIVEASCGVIGRAREARIIERSSAGVVYVTALLGIWNTRQSVDCGARGGSRIFARGLEFDLCVLFVIVYGAVSVDFLYI